MNVLVRKDKNKRLLVPNLFNYDGFDITQTCIDE
jgi:hypothetical protein